MAERFVIDASVVAKWFLKDGIEGQVNLAEEVLVDALSGRVELHAPRLMSYDEKLLLSAPADFPTGRFVLLGDYLKMRSGE